MAKYDDLMKKKKKSDMSDAEQHAKMNVVKGLRDMASGEMAKHLDGLKKVSVMSDSKQGLQEGLDKAKDLMDQMPSNPHEDGSDNYTKTKEQDGIAGPEHEEKDASHDHEVAHAFEGKETPEEESMEEDEEMKHMSEAEVDAKLKKLMALKEKHSKKKMG